MFGSGWVGMARGVTLQLERGNREWKRNTMAGEWSEGECL